VQDDGGSTATVYDSVTVIDQPVVVTGDALTAIVEGASTGSVPVATFTYPSDKHTLRRLVGWGPKEAPHGPTSRCD
jgi:hypothetical protein